MTRDRSRDRDIERVLDGWFADGPTTMPDRFFDAVLGRVDRTSQRRLAGLTTRLLPMNTNVRLAAAIAAVVVIALAAAISIGGPKPLPSPQPSPSPSPAASGSPLSQALQHRWNGPTRTVTGMTPPAVSAAVTLDRSQMRFDGGGSPRSDLGSSASLTGPNEIRFELLSAGAGCARGAMGTYAYVLSSGGGFLTLTPEADACAARSQAVSGDWERSDCSIPNTWCLGDSIEAGSHASAVFNPFLTFDAWTFQYGRLRYTVPDGWGSPEEDRAMYVIARTDLGEDASIWLLSDETAHAQSQECPENTIDPSVGGKPDQLASWLRSLPGLTATTPRPVSVGGLSGWTLDVSLKPSWTRSCPGGGTGPNIQLFADSDGKEHDVSVHGDVPMRVDLLDLGDGRSLVIFINAKDKATYDALLPGATSIIDSFQFTR
jgi:hypothetical protein